VESKECFSAGELAPITAFEREVDYFTVMKPVHPLLGHLKRPHVGGNKKSLRTILKVMLGVKGRGPLKSGDINRVKLVGDLDIAETPRHPRSSSQQVVPSDEG
jgi:hypothetical protein